MKILEKIKNVHKKIIDGIENYFDTKLHKDVHAFKSSTIEIQDTPASPIGRVMIWVICGLISFALIWSIIAEIDIVSVAQGKIVPVGNTKVIQAHTDGSISGIFVKDGDFVKSGDVLIKIDEDSFVAEKEMLEKTYDAELAKNRRATAMLDFIETRIPTKPDFSDIKSINQNVQMLLFEESYREFESSIGVLDAKLKEKEQELQSTISNIEHYKEVVQILNANEKRTNNLMNAKAISVIDYLEHKQKQIIEKNNLNNQISKEKQLNSNIMEIKKTIETTIIEKKKEQLLAFEDSFNNMNKLKEEIKKNEVYIKYAKVTAPVDGYVQELKFHTIGGVVKQAQELMKIVEANSDLEVETMVLSKDIGFVEEGMEVSIKLDSFLFTKYGLVHGTVENISEDALIDEKLGLVYKTKIKLNEKSIRVDGKDIKLSYGMGLTAEIKTGQRKVIEFFLSPIIKHLDEGARER